LSNIRTLTSYDTVTWIRCCDETNVNWTWTAKDIGFSRIGNIQLQIQQYKHKRIRIQNGQHRDN